MSKYLPLDQSNRPSTSRTKKVGAVFVGAALILDNRAVEAGNKHAPTRALWHTTLIQSKQTQLWLVVCLVM